MQAARLCAWRLRGLSNVASWNAGGYPGRTPLAEVLCQFPKPWPNASGERDVTDKCVNFWKVLILATLRDANECRVQGLSAEKYYKLQTISASYRHRLKKDVADLLMLVPHVSGPYNWYYHPEWERFLASRKGVHHRSKSAETTPEKKRKRSSEENTIEWICYQNR